MDTKIFDKIEDPKEPENDDISEENVPDLATVNSNDDPVEREISEEEASGEPKKKKRKNAPSGFISGLYDWVSAFLFALVVVLLILTFCFRIVDVDGSSMLQTLQDGNKVVVTGLNYEPQVGDIIVISHGAELNKALVKRVIAVGGQTVDIDIEAGKVIVDGVVLDEEYVNGSTFPNGDTEFPVQVAEGTVFVMGDNRPISKDSRSTEVGLIEIDNIIGKVQFRLYPFDEFGKVE